MRCRPARRPIRAGGLDEALGLAVGARGIGSGRTWRAPARPAGCGRRERVGQAVVGHDPLDADAEAGEPGERPGEEAGVSGRLVGQDLGVGQARGVIDGDVQEFPADAALCCAPRAVAGDPVADAVDPAELLDVDVDQLAGRARS